jgi:hypothetical protein
MDRTVRLRQRRFELGLVDLIGPVEADEDDVHVQGLLDLAERAGLQRCEAGSCRRGPGSQRQQTS